MKFFIFIIFAVVSLGFTVQASAEMIDDLHDSALDKMNTQNFVVAIEEYSKILEIDENDEVALINRAFAFRMVQDLDSAVDDLTKVIENNPDSLIAIKGKATLLAQFGCESYYNCGVNEALELLDNSLENHPNDKDLKMKHDYLLSKAEQFSVYETNGDYIVNIQFITRDQNGILVSVVENSGANIIPTKILEDHLDDKGMNHANTIEFKKEIVNIEGHEYLKWHIVSDYENPDRFWRGAVSLEKRVDAKSDEGYDVIFYKEVLRALIPAQLYDEGYETISIMEIFKKI